MRKAVAIRPNFPQAQNDLAYFLDQKGEQGEALEILEEVLKNDPGLRDANVTYILGLMEIGRIDDAEAARARWSRIGRDQAQIELIRARLLMGRGRLADAWRVTEELQKAPAPDNNLAFWRFSIRSTLRDGDWILRNAPEPRRKAVGAVLQGDFARAIELVDGDPIARQSPTAALGAYVPVHVFAGDSAGAVAYYDAKIATPAAAVVALKACSCSPVPLVRALRNARHKDYPALLAAWKDWREGDARLYAKSVEWNAQMGHIAALEGDAASAKTYYAKAIDYGWRSAYFIDRSVFDFIPQDRDFDALLARMKSLIDKERASLGLAPL